MISSPFRDQKAEFHRQRRQCYSRLDCTPHHAPRKKANRRHLVPRCSSKVFLMSKHQHHDTIRTHPPVGPIISGNKLSPVGRKGKSWNSSASLYAAYRTEARLNNLYRSLDQNWLRVMHYKARTEERALIVPPWSARRPRPPCCRSVFPHTDLVPCSKRVEPAGFLIEDNVHDQSAVSKVCHLITRVPFPGAYSRTLLGTNRSNQILSVGVNDSAVMG